jgi:integrase
LIIKRNGRWGVRVCEPGGRRRWLGTFDTPELAKRAEEDWTLKPGRRAPTVEQWSRVWLVDYARDAPATRRTYRYSVKQIVAEFGTSRLDQIDRPTARRGAAQWPRQTSRVARTMWADAVRDGLTENNPWTNLRLETPRGRKDITALTETEIADLAATAEAAHGDYGQEMSAIVLTLAYVACRPGELCTLRRDDLDLSQGELTIRFNLDASGIEKPPKNGKPRVVVVPPPALAAVRALPARLDSAYLFHGPRGQQLNKGWLAYHWRLTRSAWIAKGGRDLDLYELRHAGATLLIRRGLPAHVVAHQLGHSDGGRLVMQLYGHPEETLSRDLIRMAFADEGSQQGRRQAAKTAN